MTTFIKTKFKISEDQTNIDKYRLAANITVYHINLVKINLATNHYQNFCGPVNHLRRSTISDLETLIDFPSQRTKKLFKSVNKQGNLTFVVQRVI